MRLALSGALIALVLAASNAAAQNDFTNPGEVRVDDPKGSVIVLKDADRTVPTTMGTVHLRYYQGWNLSDPSNKYPSNPSTFTPGPTMRAKVGNKVSIMFINSINDKNFSYSFVTANGKANPQYGCDQSSNPAVYPAKDVFPNCFHGSSTANIHFHGTHTNPDGLGDNVLVQVMPDPVTSQDTWLKYFKEILATGSIPKAWEKLPLDYRKKQETLVKASGNGLWESDQSQIHLGQWPQYIAGGYPNIFELPKYTKGGKYKAGQAPGTMWYHAHKHGSTALHSQHGLAGAFIVEGDYDQFFKDFYQSNWTTSSEKVMVFQMINPNQNLERGGVNFGSLGPGQLLLNGQLNPTITMRPGEVQLWRVLNATPGSVFKGQTGAAGPGVLFPDMFCVAIPNQPVPPCKTAGFQLLQTAKDGVQFSPANFKNQPFLSGTYPNPSGAPAGPILAGGNRMDFLVKAPATASATPVQFYSNNTTAAPGALVFSVVIKGDPVDMKMPASTDWPAMPDYLLDLPQPADYPHQVTFGWDAEPGRPAKAGGRLTSNVGLSLPPRYTIDNRQFEQFGPLIDQCMPLGGLQEWVLVNETTVTHPFHIHINPFQITKIEVPILSTDGNSATYSTYAPASDFVWSDVVALPAGVVLNSGQVAESRVTIRQQFVDFTGSFVLHCHILAHEDRGMMQLVRVVPAKDFPAACQQAIPHHH
jgi:FtsP/CotA-like multicopper oxidase with cupredoxin domain